MADEKKELSADQLNAGRFRGSSIYGTFNSYCFLHGCCEECNRWVRLLCKIKNKIETIQEAIILSVCKER